MENKNTKRFYNMEIPDDWKILRLSDVAKVQTGLQKGAKISGESINLPYLRVANVQDGHVSLEVVKRIDVPVNKVSRYLLKKGDVLMNEGGDFDKLGRGVVWDGQIDPCVHQNHVFAVRVNTKIITPGFLNILTKSYRGKKYFILNSVQSTNLASINSSQLKKFPVIVPPLKEIKVIDHVFSIIDTTISLNNELIKQKELRRKWLMQILLTGKKRLKGFNSNWKKQFAKEFLIVRKEKALNSGKYPLYSLTIEGGIVEKSDRYEREFLVKDKLEKMYKVVYPNDIVFNPANLRWGAIAKHSKTKKVLVSPIYVIMRVENSYNADFINYLLSSPSQIAYYASIVEGTLVERMAVKENVFLLIKYMIPEIKEQTAIAQVLQAADKELELLKTKTEKLREQKKGMMQLLLTGKKRLRIN